MSDIVPSSNRELLEKVEGLLKEIADAEWQVGKKRVLLGNTLLTIRETKAYLPDFKSFQSYLFYLGQKIEKGRTQLYSYISVAENLLPKIGETELEKIPHTKAAEMASAVKHFGLKPSQSLLRKAQNTDVRIDEFRVAVAQEYQIKSRDESGKWFDLGGFLATDDERKDVLKGLGMAAGQLGLQVDVSDWRKLEWKVRRDIFLAMCRECISTWTPQQRSDSNEEEPEWEIG